MKYDFSGKTVLVTGAASGIGCTAAVKFAENGAAVAAVDIVPPDKAVKEIQEAGGKAIALVCDIADSAQVEKTIKEAVEKLGKLDFAFNCAGVGPDGVRIPFAELTDTEDSDWKKIVDINLTGTFYLMKYELRQMREQGYGSIVNTSSTGGYRFAPTFHAYAPTKAGVIALTELASNENARKGIRVNVICPGPTAGTQLSNNLIASRDNEVEFMENVLIPTGKMNSMDEVVEAVMWLCSDMARQITGQSLFVDGGMHVKP